ncbi:MAG: alpha/beta hydrolase [Betaproteobacteria bacterium]|jgi:pimeloyl-ACP methyl ester carboxylesterase
MNPRIIHSEGQSIQYVCSGKAATVTHVLLHGIGSGMMSWSNQLEHVKGSKKHQVLAWNAPGYGSSTKLGMDTPKAEDYALRMWQWLDFMSVKTPVALVGHSLGCLMAASATRLNASRVSQLILLSPAKGYGAASKDIREQKLNARLDNLIEHGPIGMAKLRAHAMLSNHAPESMRLKVQEIMSQVDPTGYTQAAQMLAHADLCWELTHPKPSCQVVVASGHLDQITPPEDCAPVAQVLGLNLIDLGPVGHACAIETPRKVSSLIGLG